MTITGLTSAIKSELPAGLAELNAVAAAVTALIAGVRRRRRARHRLDSLNQHLLRDIGYTRHGVREAALAARNEARFPGARR